MEINKDTVRKFMDHYTQEKNLNPANEPEVNSVVGLMGAWERYKLDHHDWICAYCKKELNESEIAAISSRHYNRCCTEHKRFRDTYSIEVAILQEKNSKGRVDPKSTKVELVNELKKVPTKDGDYAWKGGMQMLVHNCELGFYDDFESNLLDPKKELVETLNNFGLFDLAKRVEKGEFNEALKELVR